MKNIFLFAIAILTTGLVLAGNGNSSTVKVSTEESTLAWEGSKVTGSHNGVIAIKEGNLVVEDNVLKGGSFTIDMETIECLDLEGDWGAKLVGHLESADFFNVAEFKTAMFTITKVTPTQEEGANVQIEGDLTIKGITQSISFPAQVDVLGENATATANFTVDRTKWDIRYGSGSFIDGLGDKMIYDDIKFSIQLNSI